VSAPESDSAGGGASSPTAPPAPARQPRDATIVYPGGLRARWRWGGSGEGPAVFALTEAGGPLTDHGALGGSNVEQLCRAELRIDGPAGPWTARLASLIYDEPAAVAWDDHGLLVVKYGFVTYGFAGRSGELRWSHRSAAPLLAVLGSPRLAHVLVQSEIETFALEPDGTVAWRVAHSDVVTAVELVGGRLVLTSFGGQVSALDPVTGRAVG
jgi:outer membrane protein assembly factor BamB